MTENRPNEKDEMQLEGKFGAVKKEQMQKALTANPE